LVGADPVTQGRLARNRDRLCALARLDAVRLAETPPAGAVPFVIGEATGALAIAEFIDLAAEKTRLEKAIAALDQDISRLSKKLDNADFIARAPEAVVEENREKLAEAQTAKAKLESALARLKGLA
jgi:valyl-tRNA synthetase